MRVKRGDYSSETNSTERLKGRCFIPRGISSYSLSYSADRSFIEISAHHTDCNERCTRFQHHNNCTGKTNEEKKLAGWRKIKNKNSSHDMCIIYSHDITGEFSSFSITGGFWHYFFYFLQFSLKEIRTTKSLKGEQNCFLFPYHKVWWNSPLGIMDSVVVKLRQKCRHKNKRWQKHWSLSIPFVSLSHNPKSKLVNGIVCYSG